MTYCFPYKFMLVIHVRENQVEKWWRPWYNISCCLLGWMTIACKLISLIKNKQGPVGQDKPSSLQTLSLWVCFGVCSDQYARFLNMFESITLRFISRFINNSWLHMNSSHNQTVTKILITINRQCFFALVVMSIWHCCNKVIEWTWSVWNF